MSSAVGFNCSVRTCKKMEYVTVAEMIEAGEELLPKGWVKLDIGETGPEEYQLCSKHASEWRGVKDNALRRFVEAKDE